MRLLLRWLINALAILGIAYWVPGITVSGFKTAIVAALILGIINAVLGTILKILTLPISILTLGLFTLVINAFLFWLTAYLVNGFEVVGAASAIIGALIMWAVSWMSNLLLKK